jgi:hypothetical protein
MQSTNYISDILGSKITKSIVSDNKLRDAIHKLQPDISKKWEDLDWKQKYEETNVFINGVSIKDNSLHLVLPKITYNCLLKKKNGKIANNVTKSICCNAFILAAINNLGDYFLQSKVYQCFFCFIIAKKYAYKDYKKRIVSDITIDELIWSIDEYMSKFTQDDLEKQIRNNSNPVSTEGEKLSSSEKKSLSHKILYARTKEEIEFIVNMYYDKNVHRTLRDISKLYEERFNKKLSHVSISKIIKKYNSKELLYKDENMIYKVS